MKKSLFVIFSFFSFYRAHSQDKMIHGKVANTSKQALEYTTVALFKNDTIRVKETMTDSLGAFAIHAPQGLYTLQLTQFGHEIFRKSVHLQQENIDLGEILIDESLMLRGVTIEIRKRLIEKKIDRLVFNVENSIAAIGGDALDALRVTPRVKVKNDGISMVGKSGMAVMIDDRIVQLSGEDLLNYLKTIKSEEIKSIEVITNPSAKYSAEGNSGILNLRLKKAKKDSWNSSIRTIYKQSTYATGSVAGTFNYQKDKFTLTSGLNYLDGKFAPVESNTIYYTEKTWNEVNNRIDYEKSFGARIGIEYAISKKISTGFSYNYINSKPHSDNNNISSIYSKATNGLDSTVSTIGNENRTKKTNRLNYHLIYQLDDLKRKLTFDFDLLDYSLGSRRQFVSNRYLPDLTILPDGYEAALSHGIQKIKNYSFNLDMEHPIGFANLNYGARISNIKTKNNFEYFDIIENDYKYNPEISNAFHFQENTQSFYLSAQKEFSETWQAKIGLRVENTQTEGNSETLSQTNRFNYTKLFPTAYVSYVLNPNNTFTLNYGRRIKRPGYSLLNPFHVVNSPFSYSNGNPYLQPSYTHNVEFEYGYKDILISKVYFSYLQNGFDQITIIHPSTNIQQITPKNFMTSKTYGFNETLMLKGFNWLNFNLSADVYYASTRTSIPETLNFNDGWSGEFSVSNDVILNKSKTCLMNVTYQYVTSGVANVYTNNSSSKLDASFKMLFLDKRMTVALNFNDILKSNKPVYTTYNNNIKNSFQNYYDERALRLSLIYNFGKSFKTKPDQSKNSEEINRL
ncbi:hypothetical protein HDF26_003305 [Pedobacter cryoconitis]|uniref:outer membrane beta-barrel family protein n=1 Tax=Pedobacter cryoconitis TaxID=188932 RepID=UPI00161636F4|nr:outer membrane beta-barrel family protein [Pedobacter cryoconitis]MBB6272845.1 hypothetical protein [Pedobacter cryoconitis]